MPELLQDDRKLAETYCALKRLRYLSHERYGDTLRIAVEEPGERYEVSLRVPADASATADSAQAVTPTDPSVSVETSQSVTADRALFAGAFERLAAVVERDGATGIAEGFRLSAEILRAGKCPEELHRERQPVGGGE